MGFDLGQKPPFKFANASTVKMNLVPVDKSLKPHKLRNMFCVVEGKPQGTPPFSGMFHEKGRSQHVQIPAHQLQVAAVAS